MLSEMRKQLECYQSNKNYQQNGPSNGVESTGSLTVVVKPSGSRIVRSTERSVNIKNMMNRGRAMKMQTSRERVLLATRRPSLSSRTSQTCNSSCCEMVSEQALRACSATISQGYMNRTYSLKSWGWSPTVGLKQFSFGKNADIHKT